MKNIKKFLLIIAFLAFLIAPSFTLAATVEELQAQITALLAQITDLQTQIAQIQGQPVEWCHDFNVNLKIGDTGFEVESLQIALGKEGFDAGSSGKNKGDFDDVVASAVSGFQQKYKDEILTPLGLKYGTGFVGRATRSKLNSLYGCKVKPPITPSITVLSPNGGETWTASPKVTDTISGYEAYRQDIKWSGAPTDFDSTHNGRIRVYLDKYENGQYTTIGRIPPFAYGSIAWVVGVVGQTSCGNPAGGQETIDCFTKLFLVPLGQYYVRVVDTLTGGWDRSDSPFSIAAATTAVPSITITSSPQADSNGNVTIQQGSQITISGTPLNVNLAAYGTDFTRSFFFDPILNNSCQNNGANERVWSIWCTAQNTGTSRFYIEIYKDGKTYRSNTITMSVVSATQPSITVTSPNGGEVWTASPKVTDTLSGNEQYRRDIKWSGAPDDFNSIYNGVVKAYLDKYENGQYMTVGRIPPFAYGSIAWVVGVVGQTSCGNPAGRQEVIDCYRNMFIVPAGQYYVRIVNTQTGAWDRSNSPFSIVAAPTSTPSITVLSPNGGENYKIGDTLPITWTSANISGYRIHFDLVQILSNGSQYQTQILSNVINDGTENWTIPSSATPGSYKLLVVACGGSGYCTNSDPSASDQSNSPFSIAAAPQPVALQLNPIGAKSVAVNQELNFLFSASGVPDGTVAFSAIPLPAGANLLMLGDTTMDGSLSSLDASYILQYLEGSPPRVFSAAQKLLADVNRDGTITRADSDLLLNIVVGNQKRKDARVFSWIPVQTGTYPITFTATAGGVIAQETLTISVTPGVTSSITVLSPNGGETLAKGQPFDIKWSSQNLPTGTLITISLNHGVTGSRRNQFVNVANDGVEQWTVNSPEAEDGTYKITIEAGCNSSGTNCAATDQSNSPFSIVSGALGLQNMNNQLADISKAISQLIEGIKNLTGR